MARKEPTSKHWQRKAIKETVIINRKLLGKTCKGKILNNVLNFQILLAPHIT